MKITNRLMLTAVFVLAISVMSFAQGRGGERLSPQDMAKKQTAHLTEVLELSDDQAKEIAAISLKYIEQGQEARKTAREQEEVDREAMKAARKKMGDAQSAELKEVLTELQYAKYEGMMAERGDGRKGKRGKRGGKKHDKEDGKDKG